MVVTSYLLGKGRALVNIYDGGVWGERRYINKCSMTPERAAGLPQFDTSSRTS